MSVSTPLGAAPDAGAFDVSGPLVGPPPRPRGLRSRLRTEHVGPGATLAVPLLGLLLCMAGTRSGALVPEPLQFAPQASGMFEPLHYIGISLTAGEAAVALALLALSYLLAIRRSADVSTRVVIWAVVAFNVIVLLGPPLFSTDVFSYQAYARMFAVYHTNPYVHGPITMQGDPLYNYIGSNWINTPSVYGPLFTFLSSAFASVSVATSELAFKLIAAAASGGTLLLIWRSARLRGLDATRAVAIFGLNPLVTLYGVGGGHNDLLMLLLSTAGVYAVLTRRDGLGGGLMSAGAAIKLTGAIVLPFALLAGREPGGIREPDGARRRRSLLLGAAAVAVVIAAASGFLFRFGILHLPGTLQTVQEQGNRWQSVVGFLFQLTHLAVTTPVRVVTDVALAAALVWLLHRVWSRRLDWIAGAAWATFAVLVSAWYLDPWYVCWMLPLVALSPSRSLWRAATFLTAVGSAIMIGGCFHLAV